MPVTRYKMLYSDAQYILTHSLMSFSNSLLTLLNSRALDPNPFSHSWPFICRELLKSEFVHEQRTDIQQHLFDAIDAVIPVENKESVFARGVLERPYWKAVEECLTRGIFPWRREGENLKTLKADEGRIHEIEHKLARISPVLISKESQEAEQLQLLSDFLFTVFSQFLSPQDIRPFLSLRTTVGSRLDLFPPSLSECISTFTNIHVKLGGKPYARAKPSILTVGAKALSKHWHRDRTVGFWRVCTGPEKQKNEAANLVLADILASTAWVNLHWLNANVVAYEIRNTNGYGVRWEAPAPSSSKLSSSLTYDIPSSSESDNSKISNVEKENQISEDSLGEGQLQGNGWNFRGFLEPFMEGGHELGWIH